MPKKRYSPEQIINSLREARNISKPRKHHRTDCSTSCKTPRYYRTGLLPLEKGIRRNEGKPDQTAKGAGKGKHPA